MLHARRPTLLASTLCLSAMMTSGCGLEDLFNGRTTSTVSVFTTHGGTPSSPSQYPDYGMEGETRVFTNDEGWEVSLFQAYVTTANVRLVPCGKPPVSVEMFWGPCAENYITIEDGETLPLGAVTVDDGQFCAVEVDFAPYIVDDTLEDHVEPDNSEVEGNTIYIIGEARRGDDEQVPFEIITPRGTRAILDLSDIQGGGPLTLDDEEFPRNLKIVQTYDSFFDGIDFAAASPKDLEDSVLAALEFDTLVFEESN